MWKIWLIVAVASLILESLTEGFLVFWFAVGAMVALISSLFNIGLQAQLCIFLISSTLLMFATRPFCNHFLKNDKPQDINTIIGKIGKVTIDIDPINSKGQIKIGGETWSATANESIKEGSTVIVTDVKGVKAIVKIKE